MPKRREEEDGEGRRRKAIRNCLEINKRKKGGKILFKYEASLHVP